MTEDQLLYYGAVIVGFLVLFAGIPEGFLRVMSLARAKPRAGSHTMALPARADPLLPARADRTPLAEVHAAALDALERAIMQRQPVPRAAPAPNERREPAADRDFPRRTAEIHGIARAPGRPERLPAARSVDAPRSDPPPFRSAEPVVAATALEWFYAGDAGAEGPVAGRDLRDLLHQGAISAQTLVWNVSFGGFWRPLGDTGLAEGASTMPPPLPTGRGRRRIAGSVSAFAIVLAALAGAAAIVAVLQLRVAPPAATASRGPVPACDSTSARTLAKQAIEREPLARLINASVIDLHDIQQTDYDAAARKRSCSATAMLNTGRNAVRYSLEWLNETGEEVWIEFQQFPF
ncbi:MAG: DUF4339 domain-containing protein [Hyphomicrobiales bacterium]|nr:DUF4339 domain-containing protein [Hyphomicrobiales bacterium]